MEGPTETCHKIKGSNVVVASSSSVYDDTGSYLPTNAIDNLVIYEGSNGLFRSDNEQHAWLQISFNSTTMTIESLTIITRLDCCADKFKNIGVYVGNDPAVKGNVSRNKKCAFYKGPAPFSGAMLKLECQMPTSGRYLVIQRIDQTSEPITTNEISLCGFEGL